MDPAEDLPPPPAFFPPPAPAAVAPSPIPAAASLSGPKIFVLSPLPGNKYDVDRYFYSPSADVTVGDYAALLTFAAHYGNPLAIYQCPNLAVFQASHLLAIVHPFSEVPPPILRIILPSIRPSVYCPSHQGSEDTVTDRPYFFLPKLRPAIVTIKKFCATTLTK